MEKRIYLVHKGKKAFLTTKKTIAISMAKNSDASIRYMPHGLYKGSSSWDYPTFRIMSKPLELKKKGTFAKKSCKKRRK